MSSRLARLLILLAGQGALLLAIVEMSVRHAQAAGYTGGHEIAAVSVLSLIGTFLAYASVVLVDRARISLALEALSVAALAFLGTCWVFVWLNNAGVIGF